VNARGAAMIGTTTGLLVFLVLLLFAVQTLVTLHARSLVTATAYDAAREVAGYRSAYSRDAARVAAEEHLRARLGELGREHLDVEWLDPQDPDVVRLRVVAHHRSLLPSAFGSALGLRTTDRRIEVRVERWQ
jgi:hypothetical protein